MLPSVRIPWCISWRLSIDSHSRTSRRTQGILPCWPCLPFYRAWETDHCLQDKKVVIVHGRDLLLNDQFPDKFRRLVNQKLEARGIELILGDYVATLPETCGGEIVFRSGNKLQADLVVRTPSLTTISSFICVTDRSWKLSLRFRLTDQSQTPLGYLTLSARTRSRLRVS